MTQHDDGYRAFRALREHPSFTTEDDITITASGTANNIISQGYELTKENTSLTYRGFWGSESIFRALSQFRSYG